MISFINPTHCFTLTKPNYIALLFCKPKPHSVQYTGLKYVIYIEMTNEKFSLTSQCHKTTIWISSLTNNKTVWPSIIQQPVNAS